MKRTKHAHIVIAPRTAYIISNAERLPTWVRLPTGTFVYPRDFTEASTTRVAVLLPTSTPTYAIGVVPPAYSAAVPRTVQRREMHLFNLLLGKTDQKETHLPRSSSEFEATVASLAKTKDHTALFTMPIDNAAMILFSVMFYIFDAHEQLIREKGLTATTMVSNGVLASLTSATVPFIRAILDAVATCVERGLVCLFAVSARLFPCAVFAKTRFTVCPAEKRDAVIARLGESFIGRASEPDDDLICIPDILSVPFLCAYVVGKHHTIFSVVKKGSAYLLKSQLRKIILDILRDPQAPETPALRRIPEFVTCLLIHYYNIKFHRRTRGTFENVEGWYRDNITNPALADSFRFVHSIPFYTILFHSVFYSVYSSVYFRKP